MNIFHYHIFITTSYVMSQVAADALDSMACGSPAHPPLHENMDASPSGSGVVERRKKIARKSIGGISKTLLAAASPCQATAIISPGASSPDQVAAAATLAEARAASEELEAARFTEPEVKVPSRRCRQVSAKKSVEVESKPKGRSNAAKLVKQSSAAALPSPAMPPPALPSPAMPLTGSRRQRGIRSVATDLAEAENGMAAIIMGDSLVQGEHGQAGAETGAAVSKARVKKRSLNNPNEGAQVTEASEGPFAQGIDAVSVQACKRPRRGSAGQAPQLDDDVKSKRQSFAVEAKPSKADAASKKQRTSLPSADAEACAEAPSRRYSSSDLPAATATRSSRLTSRRLSAAEGVDKQVPSVDPAVKAATVATRLPGQKRGNVGSALPDPPHAAVSHVTVGRTSRPQKSIGNPPQDEMQGGGSSGRSATGGSHLPPIILAVSSSVSDVDKKNAVALVKRLPGARMAGKDEHNFTHLLMMPGGTC